MAVLTNASKTGVGVTLALILIAVLVGCGKKGPPRPAQRPALPAVQDLSARIEGDRAVLEWTVPTADAVKAALAGFYVHASKTAVNDRACQDCPPAFRQVGEVAFQPGTGAVHPMGFKFTIQPGVDHMFKVSAYEKGGEQVDSNIVRLAAE